MAAIRTATVWQAGGLLMLLLLPGYSSALRYVKANWEDKADSRGCLHASPFFHAQR